MKKLFSLVLVFSMLFAFAACGDDKGGDTVKKEFAAEVGSIYEDKSLADGYKASGDNFVAKQDYSFKMPEAKAKEFVADTEGKYAVFNVDIAVTNTTDKGYDLFYVGSDSSDKTVYVSRYSTGGEMGVPANSTMPIYFPAAVIVEKGDRSSNDIINLINTVNFTIYYCDAGAMEDKEEVVEGDLKKLKVELSGDDAIEQGDVTAAKADVTEAAALVDSFKNNEKLFRNAAVQYSIGEATISSFINDNSSWKSYSLNLSVKNASGGDITLYSIISANNGTNGAYICSISELGEFSIADGETMLVPVSILVDGKALGSKAIADAVKEMKLTLEYSRAPVFSEDGKESSEIKQTIGVR